MMLDTTDKRILNFLQHDSDQSVDVISEAVNLSRNAVWRRIKLLEQAGYITKRVALLDPDQLEVGLTVFIQIKTSQHTPSWAEDLSRVACMLPHIQSVYRMSGDLDYLIKARVRDMKDYDQLYQQLTQNLHLSDVSASFVMESIKDTTTLPL